VAVVAETVANCGQLWPISRGLEGFRAVFTVFVSVSNFRGAFAPFPPKIPIFLVSSRVDGGRAMICAAEIWRETLKIWRETQKI